MISKYEYKVVPSQDIRKKDGSCEEGLNSLGEEGWELVSLNYNREYIFKRKKDAYKRRVAPIQFFDLHSYSIISTNEKD